MKRKTLNINKIIIVSFVYILVYFFCIFFIKNQISKNYILNFLSTIGAYFVTYLIFYNYQNENLLKTYWLLLFLACISYAIANSLWFYHGNILNIPFSNIKFIYYINIMSYIFLSIAIFYKFYKLVGYWEMLQVLFDSSLLVIALGIAMWKFFTGSRLINIDKITLKLITNYIYILTDFLIIIASSLFYTTYKSLIHKNYFILNALGLVLYTSGDIIYMRENILNKLGLTSKFTLFGCLGLILLGISVLYEEKHNMESYIKLTGSKNQSSFVKMRYTFSILIPYLIMIFLVHDELKKVIVITVLAAVLIISRQIINKLVSLLNENRHLVNELNKLNESLENTIFKRTQELIEKNYELDYLSSHDPLTGIANRRYYMKELEDLLTLNKGSTEKIALMFIDLDHFKLVNDFLGHDMGDKLLIEVVQRIKRCIGDNDILGRQGGDEFIIILTNINYKYQILNVVYNIKKELSYPVTLDNHSFPVSMSMGIAVSPDNAIDANSLMKAADTAMYYVKDKGKNNFEFYDIQMEKDITRKVTIESELRYALFNNEFKLYYQPQFSLYDNKLIGMEALLRWQNNKLGNVSPVEFIPIAESNGLIILISEWIIEEAVKQIKNWNKTYDMNLKMGINISPKHFSTKDFVSIIKNTVELNDIKPAYLDLEITEGVAIQNIEDTISKLEELRSFGIRISIDDFGTGYSSLSYLNKLSIDTLKIDKSFILNIDENEDNYRIAIGIIALAKSLNIKVIAEGIEREEQKDVLKNLDCEQGQGYLFGKPMPADEFEEKFLKKTLLNI